MRPFVVTRSWIGFASFVIIGLIPTVSCTKTDKSSQTVEQGSGSANGKKVFRYLRTSAHKSMDPVKQFDQASAEMVSNLYDTLLDYHYLKRPYELIPNLLAEMPSKSKDGLVYTFKLRDDVFFHDSEVFKDGKGRKLTTDDVLYSIKRFADAKVNNLSYVLLKGFVVGLDDYYEASKNSKITDYSKVDVAGLKKIDDRSFLITFTEPNPLALYPFAFSGMSIVPREAVEKYGDQFAEKPVGTGPFTLKQYSRRGETVLAKNPRYHMTYPTEGDAGDKEAGLLADAGKQLPLLDEMRLPLIEESQPAMLKFLKGEIDWIGIGKDDFGRMATRDAEGNFALKGDYAKKYFMYVEPGLYSGYMAINLRDKVLGSNKALRQAIAASLNAAEWIALMRNGRGLPLNSIVPHPIAGSENDTGAKWYDTNREFAKAKLKEAGFPGGKGLPTITIEYRSTTKDSRQDFEYLRNELAAVGIKAEANFQTFSNYLTKVEKNNFQMTDSAWGADYPDAENFYQLLYSKNAAPGPNYSNFNNKEYDKLYETIRFMENGPERFKLFQRMNEIIKEEVPVILRWNVLYFGLYQPTVRNLKRNVMIDAPYKYLSIGTPRKVGS